MLPGPWLAEWAIFMLATLSMTLPIGGLVRLLGMRAVTIGFLFFTALGNPGSGLASAPELLPAPWHPLGLYLPPGAAGSALRGTAYFDGAGAAGPILILTCWAGRPRAARPRRASASERQRVLDLARGHAEHATGRSGCAVRRNNGESGRPSGRSVVGQAVSACPDHRS